MASATRRRLVSATSQPLNAEEPGRAAAASLPLPLTTVATTTRPLWVQHVLDFTPTVGVLLMAIGGAMALGITFTTNQAKINSLQKELKAMELKSQTELKAMELKSQTEMKAMEIILASRKEVLEAKLKAQDTKLKAQARGDQ
jgi:hypothetical protein